MTMAIRFYKRAELLRVVMREVQRLVKPPYVYNFYSESSGMFKFDVMRLCGDLCYVWDVCIPDSTLELWSTRYLMKRITQIEVASCKGNIRLAIAKAKKERSD